jgi:hypothetical protein
MPLRLGLVLLLFAVSARAAEIKGRVTNAVGGEVLGRVEVSVLDARVSTATSPSGEFAFPGLAPGIYTLRLNAVGYRLLTIPFTLATADESKEFSITMVPDNFRVTEQVEVKTDIFRGTDPISVNEINLTSAEIKEASTVFADDPFRAVQSLPGISASANNEFFAEFSVMGAPFSTVSIYLDEILVPSPFHEIGKFSEGASLGVLTSEVVEEMKLLPAAYPEKFGDGIGAALDVHTRDGSRVAPLFRLSAGLADTDFEGEGALGNSRKGSWLASVRKSYINYLIGSRVQGGADVGFYDGSLKLSYDLTPRQSVDFYATGGHTSMTVNDAASLTADDYGSGRSDFTLARAGWRWSANPHLLLDARSAFIREPDELRNPATQILNTNDYAEWVAGGGLTWNWAAHHVLEAGWTTRRLRNDSSFVFYDANINDVDRTSFHGTGNRNSGFAQQASSFFDNRFHALMGVRWDSLQQIGVRLFSPQISLALRAAASTEIQVGFGRYAQFPDFGTLAGACFPFGNLLQRSNHYTAAVEQRLGEHTRLRLEAFDRQNASLLGINPGWTTAQSLSGSCPALQPSSGPSTYQRNYSRGVQLMVQRRSSNRLSGWLGYTLTQARQREYAIPVPFNPYPFPIFVNTSYYPTLEDQRHSLNAFAMYRLRPTVNLSGKWLYGSGFPVPSGTFVAVGNSYLPVGFNQTRLGPYVRLDIRADKDWAFTRWKLTLYGEVLNLTGHDNRRYAYSSGIDPDTGQTQVKTLQGLPITPTAGLVFQF